MTKKGKKSEYPFYELSIASLTGVERVLEHCLPLLQGYKYFQVLEFMVKSKAFNQRVKEFEV